jgi:hypothetical protein
MMNFPHRFPEEKKSPGHKHDVAPGIGKTRQDRLGQMHQPKGPGDENQPRHQSEQQPDDPRAIPLIVGHARHHDGNDQHVVDPQHQFQTDQQSQGGQRVQGKRIRQQSPEIHSVRN